jgi:hypothetical protein
MVTWFSPLITLTTLVTFDQPATLMVVFCSKWNPAGDAGQARTTVLVVVRNNRNVGAPGVCVTMYQKPLVSE